MVQINKIIEETFTLSVKIKLVDHDRIARVPLDSFGQYDLAPADIPLIKDIEMKILHR